MLCTKNQTGLFKKGVKAIKKFFKILIIIAWIFSPAILSLTANIPFYSDNSIHYSLLATLLTAFCVFSMLCAVIFLTIDKYEILPFLYLLAKAVSLFLLFYAYRYYLQIDVASYLRLARLWMVALFVLPPIGNAGICKSAQTHKAISPVTAIALSIAGFIPLVSIVAMTMEIIIITMNKNKEE